MTVEVPVSWCLFTFPVRGGWHMTVGVSVSLLSTSFSSEFELGV